MASSASKRVTIDCGEDVEVGEVSSVFSTPVALSYDHILEQIFDSLGITDLLNCRLVSHRWLFLAKKPLQKQIGVNFSNNELDTLRSPIISGESSSKHLTELTALLKKGQSLPDCEVNGHPPIIFPCNNFFMDGKNLSNDAIQQFFNTNGRNVQELSLISIGADAPSENVLMDQMANLLLHQAPNLQNIYVGIVPAVSWQIGNPDRSEKSQLQQTDPEYKEICQKAKDLLQSTNGSSLKVLGLLIRFSAKVLEFVIRISPNLEEIIVDKEYYKYLLEPENRLSFLKSLEFNLDPEDPSSVEEMETISWGKFKLTKIEINLDRVSKWIKKHPDFEPKIAQMLNRIFQGSWDTLEEIKLDQFNFLRGMTMPEEMTKVKKIEILNSRNFKTDPNSIATVFPFGFKLQNAFPKLRHVSLANFVDNRDSFRSFPRFLDCLHFGADPCDPLSTSVTSVTLFGSLSPNQTEHLRPLVSQRIQQWFPNAVLEIV